MMMLSLLLTTLAACGARGYQPPPYQLPAPYPPYAPYPVDYDDDYYYVPQAAPAPVPYPYRAPYEPPYSYYPQDPLRLEERAAREAALPVGQETWYESEPQAPRWRPAGLDDVNAAFLQNLIISQMARNAENRARALAQPHDRADTADEEAEEDAYAERDARDFEDEDVRELKALAGKPLYHSAKTEPRAPPPTNRYADYYDYPADDSFINWGSKRAIAAPTGAPATAPSAAAPAAAAASAAASAASAASAAAAGQREEVMLRPATPVRHPFPEPVMKMLAGQWSHEKRAATSVYDEIKHMLASESNAHDTVARQSQEAQEAPRLRKRFVSSDPDLVAELHGLKRRMAT